MPHALSLPEFADRLNEILPAIMRKFFNRQTNEFFKGKITLPQYIVLEFLKRQEEAKMTDIAAFLGVTTAAATGIIDRLVKCGYVTRMHQPGDRRVVKIRLTAKGTEVVKKILQEKRQMIMEMFGALSQAERDEYIRILMRIQESMNRSPNN
jgi:DNA-binding MarR family transcriptional regulator